MHATVALRNVRLAAGKRMVWVFANVAVFPRSATVHCSPTAGVRSAETSHTSRVASTQVSRIRLLFRVFVRRLRQLRCNHIEALQLQSRAYPEMRQHRIDFT